MRAPGRTRICQARDRRACARGGHMNSSAPASNDTPQNWWSTSIIEMKPGMIRYRGYAIEELIGRLGFAEMVYLMTRGELPHPASPTLLEPPLFSARDPAPPAPP